MKMSVLAILLLLHPVHVSLTGIEYFRKERTYNIFIKVYVDDLQSDLKAYYGKVETVNAIDDDKLSDYLNERMQIIENGKHLEMEIVTSENDGVEQRLTLVARGRKRVRDVTVVNTIMRHLYTDQANMCLFKFNEIEDAYKFTGIDTLKNYCIK